MLGIEEETAVRGMLRAEPDPGTTKITRVRDVTDGPFYWVPMFAVNDWESTTRVFRDVVAEDLPADCRRVVAMNNRADRTDRAAMFVDVIAQDLVDEIDAVVLYGELQEVVSQRLIAAGVPEHKVKTTYDLDGDQVASGRDLVARAREGFEGEDVAIFGMVNIHTEHVVAMQRYVGALAEEKLPDAAPAPVADAASAADEAAAPAEAQTPALAGREVTVR
ncbi:MAG: hypothetical protein L0K27_01125 [Corynebacterium nuruki]|nr:hypothetical protein [Corynebacterium nuruki]